MLEWLTRLFSRELRHKHDFIMCAGGTSFNRIHGDGTYSYIGLVRCLCGAVEEREMFRQWLEK